MPALMKHNSYLIQNPHKIASLFLSVSQNKQNLLFAMFIASHTVSIRSNHNNFSPTLIMQHVSLTSILCDLLVLLLANCSNKCEGSLIKDRQTSQFLHLTLFVYHDVICACKFFFHHLIGFLSW